MSISIGRCASIPRADLSGRTAPAQAIASNGAVLECITEAPIAAAGISIRYTIVYADDVAGVADTTLASNEAPLGSQGECNGCCQEDTNESGFVHGEYYGCTQDSMDEKGPP